MNGCDEMFIYREGVKRRSGRRWKKMSSSGRSVSMVWVFMLILSMVKNGMGEKVVVRATNSLGENVNLDIECTVDEGPPITLIPGTSHQWNYFFDKEFICFFQWFGAQSSGYHSFDMFVKSRDKASNLSWFIKPDGPCRVAPDGSSLCFRWKT